MRRYERYVAIGDSSTEGWDDPDGRGGFRGWATRLAERIAALQGGLLHANFGVRGKRTREIFDEQLEPALALRPDLVTLFSGTNDILARRFDPAAVAADIERLQRAFRGRGTTLLTFTLPDLRPVMPAARILAARQAALNEAVRRASAATGALLVDFAAFPVASDRRLWSDDRLHANSEGHARIAAALADRLGLPGADRSWTEPLPQLPRRGRGAAARAELAWFRRHLLPWLLRSLVSRRLAEDRGGPPRRARQPELLPVVVPPEVAALAQTAFPPPAAPAVFVDALWHYASNKHFPYRQSCHLFSESIDALHALAEGIGMQREWFQTGNKGLPHYDLNAERRAAAIALGAVELSRREAVAKWRVIRAAQGSGGASNAADPPESPRVQRKGVESSATRPEG